MAISYVNSRKFFIRKEMGRIIKENRSDGLSLLTKLPLNPRQRGGKKGAGIPFGI